MALAPQLATACRAIAGVAVAMGCLVAASWVFGLPGLSRIHPLLGGMSPRASVCFIFAGTSLLLVPTKETRGWRRHLSRICAAVVLTLALVTLAFAWGFDRGIDGFFQGQMFPGRMPVPTALVFLAFGLALLLIDVEIAKVRPTEFLSFAAALISALALIGYGYNFVSFFDIPRRRPLAFHTVFLMLAFAFALLASRPRSGFMRLVTSRSVGGVMTRRMLPAAFGVPILAGWLITEGQRAGLYAPVLNVSYYTLLIITVFSVLIWTTALSLHRLDVLRREAEEKLSRLNDELEQRVAERTVQLESANKELEAFSYSVSHDLRAPLRHIGGFAQLLAREEPADGDPKRQRYLMLISEAVTRMGELIDGLLSFSRMARSEMMKTRIDLNSLVRMAQAEVESESDGHSIVWTVHPLPVVHGDATMLKQVFANLLSNAAKYSRTRQPATIEVGSFTTESTPAETVIYVRDNGVGFDMKYVDKLFGVFQRLHRVEDFEGSGIGLANVHRIVARHGGRVWAEAKPDEGATFYVALPVT
jgi:signal transduction histidine kinase